MIEKVSNNCLEQTETTNVSMLIEEEVDGVKIKDYDISSLPKKNIWNIFGYAIPKQEVMFFSQIIALYIIITTALINITIQNENNLWLNLLSASIGYLLPNPSIKTETIIIKRSKHS